MWTTCHSVLCALLDIYIPSSLKSGVYNIDKVYVIFPHAPAAGGTDTVAYGPDSEGNYSLHGYKWFTSATDANMAFTLARIVTDQGDVTAVS